MARNNIIRTNGILFIIVILLTLIAWFQPGLHQTTIHYLTSLKANEVNTIIIERQDIGTITLKKQKNGWLLQEPYQLPANPLRIGTITALAEKRSYSQFQVDNNELARYQLDKPPVSVWLNDSKFTLGSEESINHQRYAINIEENGHSGKKTVHLIEGTIFYQLRANLDTFISLALLPPQARIKHIVWPDNELSIAKGRWTLTPDSTEIPSDNIARFIQFWQHARASKIETNVSLLMSNAEQLKSPGITISFTTPSSNDSAAIDSIHYLIIQDGEQIKLLRTDIQIAYWISPRILKQLTELSSHQIPQ